MYPIEIDIARAIAKGKAVTDVTWDAVAELNAKHADEHAEETKTTALELLRRNSRDAANAVRTPADVEAVPAIVARIGREVDGATPHEFTVPIG